jgi:hypothetical protein
MGMTQAHLFIYSLKFIHFEVIHLLKFNLPILVLWVFTNNYACSSIRKTCLCLSWWWGRDVISSWRSKAKRWWLLGGFLWEPRSQFACGKIWLFVDSQIEQLNSFCPRHMVNWLDLVLFGLHLVPGLLYHLEKDKESITNDFRIKK